jgi:GMP synthase (glutamine-hydrolysing)
MEDGGFCEMILLINICKEKLHYYEFVKPIEDILKKNKIKFFVKNYKDMSEEDLDCCDKVIICGTSLKDNEFIKNFQEFDWLIDFEKPVLGICGGMHIIGLVFGGIIKKGSEIGFYKEVFNKTSVSLTSKERQEVGDKEKFKKNFLGLKDEQEVYHLHNNYIDFNHLGEFEVFNKGKIAQAVKCNDKDIYGVLFHPEVRQKGLIREFCIVK